MNSDILHLLLQFLPAILILIGLSAYFSGSETGYVSLNLLKIRTLEVADKRVKLVSKMISDMENLLATTLVGTNIALISLTSLFAVLIAKLFPHQPENIRSLISSLVLTPVVIVFAEVTPKMYFRAHADRIIISSVYLMRFFWFLFLPVVKFVQFFTAIIMFILGIKKSQNSPFVTKEEFKLMFELGKIEGIIQDEEEKMITSIIGFGKKIAREVMTPRTEVFAMEINTSVEEAIKIGSECGFSRIPVYSETIDDLKGFIYTIDFILREDELEKKLSDFVRPPLFVPEYKNIDDLLSQMQQEKIHMALVIDEYGGFSGVITIEDILEEIVGEINDEMDADDIYYKKVGDRAYLVDAKLKVECFNDLFSMNLELSSNYDTIGGYIYNYLQHIPESDEQFEINDVKFRVIKVSKNKIIKLRIDLPDRGDDAQEKSIQ